MWAPEEFFGPGNDIDPTNLPPEQEVSIESWLDDIGNKRIAFLPRATGGNLYWYAFAPTPREQKELLLLLDAWIGPTFSDLPRSRGRLYPRDPFDTVLAQGEVPPLRFEVLPRKSPFARDTVRQSLIVLSKLTRKRPPSEFDAPRTTVEILDDLGHAIGARDQRAALDCLHELETIADLDPVNLAFLRIRVNAGLGDADAILRDPDLTHLMQMRRPAGVTRLVQGAVYDRYLAEADLARDPDKLARAAAAIPSHLRSLTGVAQRTDRASVMVEFLLAFLRNAPAEALVRMAEEARSSSIDLSDLLGTLVPVIPEPADGSTSTAEPQAGLSAEVTPGDQLHQLIELGEWANAVAFGLKLPATPPVAALLLSCVRELMDAATAADVAAFVDNAGLRAAVEVNDAVVRADLEWLEQFLSPERTLGWTGWFDALEAGDATAAAADFNVTADWAQLDRSVVAERITMLSDEALARMGEHGGAFLAAHSSLFSAADGAELCERVLAGFAVSGKSSLGVRVQTVALLEYMAASSPAPDLLAAALEWTRLIIEAATSAVTANWAVDVLQAATMSPQSLAQTAKHGLLFGALDVLRPLQSSLSLADLEGLRLVAEELDTALPGDFVVDDALGDPAAPFLYLKDAVVVLYSLTESATTRAAQVLRRLIPGIDVRTTAEHVGSPQLAALSANADVFVIVAASAKHAATEFIKANRGGRPVVQVNSRGSSAILRELAEG
ncbi:protein DpdD [Cellulosimicrobium cellulans]|uniref:protein DpdD n=1 Tax=Cellulosimicrobium cellulans TaxID=1710 RepID=UPI0028AE751F|nr:protein DpdD [Cellulosimicrobium cellulans]